MSAKNQHIQANFLVNVVGGYIKFLQSTSSPSQFQG
jgi:hypothetical protein